MNELEIKLLEIKYDIKINILKKQNDEFTFFSFLKNNVKASICLENDYNVVERFIKNYYYNEIKIDILK